jgi:hypothetical protein
LPLIVVQGGFLKQGKMNATSKVRNSVSDLKIMQSTKVLTRGTLWSLLFALAVPLAGCNSKETAPASGETSNSATASSATAAPEAPLRSSTGPAVQPAEGFGNAQGRVLWNEKPAADIKVTLCETISFVSGCSGKTYSARTDKDGNYTVDKVPPGEYGLAIQVFDTDNFVYPTNGVLSAAKFKVEKGETLDVRATNLYKTDLQVMSPKAGETVKTGAPKLTWKPYAGASTYEINLMGTGGGAVSQNLKSSSTSVAPEKPLLNGAYQWEVVARNANGIKIASTSTATPFKVAGQSGSAMVNLVAPAPDAVVSGNAIKLSWKAHPLANGYQIYLASAEGGDPILAFEKVEGTQFSLTKELKPGTYFWSINATRDGEKVAASELKPFRVK